MALYAAPESRGVSYFRLIAALSGATVVAAAFGLFSVAAAAADIRPWTATPPAPFTLPQLGAPQSQPVALTDQHADTILVHFFASWCEPCRDELPALQRLASRGAPGTKVLAIAVADNDASLRRLIDATGVTFPVLMDRDRAVARAWSISTLPSTVVLDSRHLARLIVESDVAWDSITPTQLHAQQTQLTQGGPQ